MSLRQVIPYKDCYKNNELFLEKNTAEKTSKTYREDYREPIADVREPTIAAGSPRNVDEANERISQANPHVFKYPYNNQTNRIQNPIINNNQNGYSNHYCQKSGAHTSSYVIPQNAYHNNNFTIPRENHMASNIHNNVSRRDPRITNAISNIPNDTSVNKIRVKLTENTHNNNNNTSHNTSPRPVNQIPNGLYKGPYYNDNQRVAMIKPVDAPMVNDQNNHQKWQTPKSSYATIPIDRYDPNTYQKQYEKICFNTSNQNNQIPNKIDPNVRPIDANVQQNTINNIPYEINCKGEIKRKKTLPEVVDQIMQNQNAEQSIESQPPREPREYDILSSTSVSETNYANSEPVQWRKDQIHMFMNGELSPIYSYAAMANNYNGGQTLPHNYSKSPVYMFERATPNRSLLRKDAIIPEVQKNVTPNDSPMNDELLPTYSSNNTVKNNIANMNPMPKEKSPQNHLPLVLIKKCDIIPNTSCNLPLILEEMQKNSNTQMVNGKKFDIYKPYLSANGQKTQDGLQNHQSEVILNNPNDNLNGNVSPKMNESKDVPNISKILPISDATSNLSSYTIPRRRSEDEKQIMQKGKRRNPRKQENPRSKNKLQKYPLGKDMMVSLNPEINQKFYEDDSFNYILSIYNKDNNSLASIVPNIKMNEISNENGSNSKMITNIIENESTNANNDNNTLISETYEPNNENDSHNSELHKSVEEDEMKLQNPVVNNRCNVIKFTPKRDNSDIEYEISDIETRKSFDIAVQTDFTFEETLPPISSIPTQIKIYNVPNSTVIKKISSKPVPNDYTILDSFPVHLLKPIRNVQVDKCVFVCQICDAQFDEIHGHLEHMSTHMPEAPYGCEKCRRRFDDPEDLDSHMDERHKRTKFHCEHCSKVFTNDEDLKKHVNTKHSKPLIFKCHRCKKEFTGKFRFEKHMKIRCDISVRKPSNHENESRLKNQMRKVFGDSP